MLRLFKWLASIFRRRVKRGGELKRGQTDSSAEGLHPLVRAALERERKQQIVTRLQEFYRRRPRPWRP